MKKRIQTSAGVHWRAQPTLPSWFCIGVCLTIASATAQTAPLDLSNQSLDAITASNPGPSVINHQPSQPVTNSVDSGSKHDIVDGTGIVVDQSRATAEIVNEVALTGAAQQLVRAANVVNTVVSDSASGINVFSSMDDNSPADNDGFVVSQSNLIEQTGARHAGVGRYSVAEGASIRTFNETRSEYSLREKHSEIELIDRTSSVSFNKTEFSASVPATTIGDLVFEVEEPSKTLTPIIVPLTGKDSSGNPYVQVRLLDAELELGSIVWSDEKGIELQSATLTLPTFQVGVTKYRKDKDGNKCCAYTEWTTISDEAITLSFHNVTLLDIENPVDELGAVGFAAYGNGEIVTSAGKLSLSTEISLNRILNAAIGDLKKIGIPGTNINLDSLLGDSLPVFDFGISADLDPFKGLADSFGSDAVAEMYCTDSTTCTLRVSTTDTTNSEHISTETSSSMELHSSSHNRSETFSQRAPVEAQEAEAKIVVLGESSVKAERYNIVLVNEGSQNDIRVLNGVNASNSITGNSVNIVADQATAQMPAQNRSNSYSQMNRITQIGGL